MQRGLPRRLRRAIFTTSPAITAITAARPATAASESSKPAADRARNRSTLADSDRQFANGITPMSAVISDAHLIVAALPARIGGAGGSAEAALRGGARRGVAAERRECSHSGLDDRHGHRRHSNPGKNPALPRGPVIPGRPQRVGASRRPMTGSRLNPESRDYQTGYPLPRPARGPSAGRARLAKCCAQSIASDSIFQTTSFADTASRSRRAYARVLPERPALELEGAGNAGRPPRPQPRVQNKKAHEHSHHGHTGITRHSLRNGFNGFLRALPGDRAFLSPSSADMVLSEPGRADLTSADLTPASRRQDHTTSPSASAPFVRKRYQRPPHPAPRP